MVVRSNLRVLVMCLTYEVQKPLKAIEHYRPDKIYLIAMTRSKAYQEFKKEIEFHIPETIEYTPVETTVYKFQDTLKEVLTILKKERLEGNHTFVDITGPPAYSAAAMVGCMMEGAQPFFCGTIEYLIPPEAYFKEGRAIGISTAVHEPFELPTFNIERPEDGLVKALQVWNEIKENAGLTTDTRVIKALADKGLMTDVYDERDHVTQNAKMKYRRRFLDKWLEKKWITQAGRGRYELTEAGSVALKVFD